MEKTRNGVQKLAELQLKNEQKNSEHRGKRSLANGCQFEQCQHDACSSVHL